MSFGPPFMLKPDAAPQPWTRRDTWAMVAYALCSAATIGTVLYVAQQHQPQPPAAVTQPAAIQPAANPR